MVCYPICLGRLVVSLAFSLIVSLSFAPPDKTSYSVESVVEVSEERKRWLQLKSEIAYHDDLYYKKASPEISDADYDALKDEFLRLEKRFGGEAGSVGDDRAGHFSEARHFAPMLSLEKAYSKSELLNFNKRIVELAGSADVRYSVEPKIDGIAASVLYENGEFVRAVTRGNGEVGEVISENVLSIEGLPKTLSGTSLPRRVELRGEIFVTFDDFRRVNEMRVEQGAEPFAHPRTLAAGSAKLSDAAAVKGRRLSIVFFGVGVIEPVGEAPSSQGQFCEMARGWGVPVLKERVEVEGRVDLLGAVERMQQGRLSYAYPTDGLVVKVDSFELQRKLGESRSAPHWAIAYKSAGPLTQTTLLGVSFQVGRSGALTPVAELAAVKISGSWIERASLHNLQEIEKMDLRIGDTVFLKKAGEIIPQVVAVNLAKRDPASHPFVRPRNCPSCGSPLDYQAERAKVFCRSLECPERIKRRLEHFVSSAAMDLEGWGPATIGGLVDRGFVGDIADLYLVEEQMLQELEHVGLNLADQLIKAREESKTREVWRFIYGIGIPGIGEVGSRKLAESMGGLSELDQLGSDAIGRSRAQAVSKYFANGALRAEFERLLDLEVCIGSKNTFDPVESILSGKVFVFTGRLDSMTRQEAIDRVESAGGSVRNSVTRDCDYLVAGSSPGGKLSEANARGIEVISEAAFLELSTP